jgi:hypothetical protein
MQSYYKDVFFIICLFYMDNNFVKIVRVRYSHMVTYALFYACVYYIYISPYHVCYKITNFNKYIQSLNIK